MKVLFLSVLASVAVVFAACRSENHRAVQPTIIPVPCRSGGEPNLHVTQEGKVLLSWVEYLDDTTDALVFSRLEGASWQPPVTIATGSDWFVNWADFPSVVAFRNAGQVLAAHWLQKSSPNTFDYDVRISISSDGGRNWLQPFTLHNDGVPAEHGFASLMPQPDGSIFAVWLDGRHSKPAANNSAGDHGHTGAMSLRCATFDQRGNISEETALDDRVCDCCQTAAVSLPNSTIVAYRNRSEEEIRDIFITRFSEGVWSTPRAVFPDNWHISACPVNGPALASSEQWVALAWFTAADGKPAVKVAFSPDRGATWQAPLRVDEGNPMGRVSVVFSEGENAIVCWMEEGEQDAGISFRRVSADGRTGPVHPIARTAASRQSGFPGMVKAGRQLIFAWTSADSTHTRIESATLDLEDVH